MQRPGDLDDLGGSMVGSITVGLKNVKGSK